jgi:hypothetical protein
MVNLYFYEPRLLGNTQMSQIKATFKRGWGRSKERFSKERPTPFKSHTQLYADKNNWAIPDLVSF